MIDLPVGVVLREQEPLARHCPHRLGGPCDAFVVIHRREALPDAVAACRDQGWNRTLLGAGSRTLVRDGGLAGAVLRLGQDFVHVRDDGDGVWVGAATSLGWAASRVPGLEPLRYASGSLGASLALDAGWGPWVDRVRVLRRGGERECGYEEIASPASAFFVEARLRTAPGARLPEVPRQGSWFAPVDDEDVVALLRDASLSATRLRGVCLPKAAPDRVVNLGDGTVKDAAMLMKSVIERVHQAQGVKLQDAMRWAGRHT